MMFRKLENQNKAEYVVGQILAAIKEEVLKGGDKLPPEVEIAEMTGVSRPSVREALGALRLIGIVDTKVGDGTYIKAAWNTNGRELESRVLSMLEQTENPFEALEARRIVEPVAARLALARLNEQKIKRIRKWLQEMQEAAKKRDMEGFHLANKEFHGAIVEATENTRLSSYVNILLNLFTSSDLGLRLKREYLTDSSYITKSLRTHELIFESILNVDGTELQEAFDEHFTLLEEQIVGG